MKAWISLHLCAGWSGPALSANCTRALFMHCASYHTVPGNCMPLGRQTTKGSPSRTWQAGGGSFLLLPRRHGLSGRWLWAFNHNTCENRLEEVQGAATSYLLRHFTFKTCGHVYSSCVRSAMLHAVRLGHWQNQTSNVCSGMTGRNDRAMIRQICNVRPQDVVTNRSMSYLRGLALRIWTSF